MENDLDLLWAEGVIMAAHSLDRVFQKFIDGGVQFFWLLMQLSRRAHLHRDKLNKQHHMLLFYDII